MTADKRAVLDASVFVRSVIDPGGQGARWVAAVDGGTVEGHTAVLADATGALEALHILPLRLHGQELASAALGAAVELGLSAYDGTYAALAESHDAVLVTADRRLAAAVRSAELVE